MNRFSLILCFILGISFSGFCQDVTFEYTGDVQTYDVPDNVSSIKVVLFGAGGGKATYTSSKYRDKFHGGKGGKLQATIPVEPGSTIYIFVGGKGRDASKSTFGKGGFNGGGNGAETEDYGPYCGGGGGGATDIRMEGKELEHRVLICGGGGGSGANYPEGGDDGGAGGNEIADDGHTGDSSDDSVGKGGTQFSGGEGGQWTGYPSGKDGRLGYGGAAPDSTSGGGGGGGYYGGGGGSWSGGGGGSSFASSNATDVKHTSGVNSGHGKVIITPIQSDFQTINDSEKSLPFNIWTILGGGITVIIVIVSVYVFLRRRKKRTKAAQS